MLSAASAGTITAEALAAASRAEASRNLVVRIARLPLVSLAGCADRRSMAPRGRPGSRIAPRARFWLECARSIRKRPHPQLLLANLPQTGKPRRLADPETEG